MEHRATTGHLSLHTTHAPLQYHTFAIPQLYNTIPLQYHNFTIQHHTCTLLHLYYTIPKDTCTIPFQSIPGAPAWTHPTKPLHGIPPRTCTFYAASTIHNSTFQHRCLKVKSCICQSSRSHVEVSPLMHIMWVPVIAEIT